MLNVFISSTYQDLKDYRDEACAFVRALQLGHVAMEHFPAESRPVPEAVVRKLSKSHLYVGIVAWRYGSRLPSDERRSYVKFEYEQACKQMLPRLVFVTEQGISWPHDFIDTNQEMVLSFRSVLESEAITFRSFRDLSDFRVKFVHSLHQAVQQSTQFRKLSEVKRTMIDLAGFTSRDLAAREAQIASGGITSDSGAKWFIQEISRCNLGDRFYIARSKASGGVSDWLVKHQKPYLFLIGPSGIGKTNFVIEYMRHIIRQMADERSAKSTAKGVDWNTGIPRVALFLPLGRAYDPKLSVSKCFEQHIASDVRPLLQSNHNGSKKTRLLPHLRARVFRELIRSGRALVILDGLDELARLRGEAACHRLFKALSKEIDPKRSAVIISCRDHIYRRLRNRALPVEQIQRVDLALLTPAELRVAVTARLGAKHPGRHAILNLSAVRKLALNPLLLEMMYGIPRNGWKKLANEPKPACLYDLWFRDIIHRRNKLPGAFEEAADQLGRVASLMLANRTDLLRESTLGKIGLPVKRLPLLTGEPFGILIQQSKREWGFVHDSFREYALARRISNELCSGHFDLLIRTDGLDYIGAETYEYLQDMPDRVRLLIHIEAALRAPIREKRARNNLVNNCVEMLGMMAGAAAGESQRCIPDILQIIEQPGKPGVRSLSIRTQYNLVRCLERLHPSAPRPYFQYVQQSRAHEPTRLCFGAFAVRGFHRTHPEVGSFRMEIQPVAGRNTLRQRVSECLVCLLRQALKQGKRTMELGVNCSFALIRWLHVDHVADAARLLEARSVAPKIRGNLFHAFRLNAPSSLRGASHLFAGMEVSGVHLSEEDLSPDFVFRNARFVGECTLVIPDRRFEKCTR